MLRHAGIVAALLVGLMLAACGKATGKPAATPTVTPAAATATPAEPTATPTPDLALLLRDGGVAIIEKAYSRLLDEYINPPDHTSLLRAAWTSAAQKAKSLGIAGTAAPEFTGDRGADFAAFRDAYMGLIAGAADPKEIRFAAIRGMAESLHDCHTFFLNPVASDTLIGTRAGKGIIGIGVELAGMPPLVTEVIPGGPADRAGVLVGDRIIAVDGRDTSSLGPAGAFDLINGDEGTSVSIELRRPERAAPIDVTMTRERVTPPNIQSRIVGSGIGYVRVRAFIDGGISAALKDTLMRFESRGVTKWIIDLRDNPGGRLDLDAISLFVKDGVILRDHNRSGKVREDQASGDVLPLIRPTVLLTNSSTGSVAEAFAAALQEYHVAYVMGTKTNGCVGFTDVQPLGDGSSLAVTTDVNLGPVTDRPLNGVGVTPDEIIARTSADIANGLDPQLDAAITHLGG